MILSHKYRFIFLKTAKTAGSSVEAALGHRCGDDDIITGHHLSKFRRNYALGLGRMGIHVPGEIARRLPEISGYYPHMPARQVRRMVGREVWDSYFKFTVERNPWDRQLSAYFYRHWAKQPEVDFPTYLTSWRYGLFHTVRIANWEIYTLDDDIAVDYVLRYEALDDDFAEVCRRLGIKGKTPLPRSNVGPRSSRGHYRDHYDERSRLLVANWYAKEIRAFGYEF